jgi:hypothetical protein
MRKNAFSLSGMREDRYSLLALLVCIFGKARISLPEKNLSKTAVAVNAFPHSRKCRGEGVTKCGVRWALSAGHATTARRLRKISDPSPMHFWECRKTPTDYASFSIFFSGMEIAAFPKMQAEKPRKL